MKDYKAVILAAGISRRLGFNKLKVRIDGELVIQKAVKPFLDASVGQVIVVTGPDSDIGKEFTQDHVVLVENRNYVSGMSTSVIAALPFVHGAFGVFFHLGDKPFIDRSIIENMARLYEKNGKRTIVPIFRDMKGHPILMDVQNYRGEIDHISGDKGLREIIENHSKDVIFIRGNEGSLFDLDTLEDIEYLTRKGHTIEKSQS